ncbi:MAG: ABC-2 family transporter protein [Bacillota bacterium]
MLSAGVRKYWVLASKGFAQNLQYSASHLINTAASAIFGVIYIYLWKSVTPPTGFGGYTPFLITSYISINQTTMWFTQFGIRAHTKIREAIRSGNIATELARPMDFFSYRVVSEYGSMVYSFIFRGLPVGLMLSTFGLYVPRHAATWMWTLLSLLIGAYIAIVESYLVGVIAFWTIEIRTAWWVMLTLNLTLGGGSMPLEVLPPALYNLARWSPFACLTYNPARIYLELSGPELIWPALFWAVVITLFARRLTAVARAKLEVQGG